MPLLRRYGRRTKTAQRTDAPYLGCFDELKTRSGLKFVAAEVTRRMASHSPRFPPPHVGGYMPI